jgi:hypothetical protein
MGSFRRPDGPSLRGFGQIKIERLDLAGFNQLVLSLDPPFTSSCLNAFNLKLSHAVNCKNNQSLLKFYIRTNKISDLLLIVSKLIMGRDVVATAT